MKIKVDFPPVKFTNRKLEIEFENPDELFYIWCAINLAPLKVAELNEDVCKKYYGSVKNASITWNGFSYQLFSKIDDLATDIFGRNRGN